MLNKEKNTIIVKGAKKKIVKPLFSIITVVLNGEKTIEKTIKSVLNQPFKNYEYIVIDGRSKDKTLTKVKKYKKNITKIISKKDKGLYHAMNKGMKLSNGQYICIVNCGDVLTKYSLMIIKNYIIKNPSADFIFGSVKKHWGIVHGYRPEKIKYSWGFYSSHSTGFFLKNSSAKKIGFYNLNYKHHADYDYFYRMIVKKKMKGISTKKYQITGIFEKGGYSSISPFREKFFEELKIRYNNNQNIILIFIIALYKSIKYFKKIIL